MKLSYQSQGTGPALIIIHGLFGSADNWRSVAKLLAGFARVITVDLRNHGQSPHSDEMNYDVMADDIAELITDLALQQVDVIGHSIGGKVAMTLTARYPAMVRRLVVVDMAPKQYLDSHSDIFKALLHLDLSTFSKRNEVDAALASEIPEKAVRQFLLMNVAMDSNGLYWRINLQGIADNYATLLNKVCEGQEVMHVTLFLRGGSSNYIEPNDDKMIKQIFPNSDIVTFEQTGHWIHAEMPQPFITTVSQFFNYD